MLISTSIPFLDVSYLLSIPTVFEDLKFYVPRCYTEKRDKLGLLQLVGKLCLLLKVSNP